MADPHVTVRVLMVSLGWDPAEDVDAALRRLLEELRGRRIQCVDMRATLQAVLYAHEHGNSIDPDLVRESLDFAERVEVPRG